MKGFIYKITNKVNGKVYIGQTIQNVKERFYQHCAHKCNREVGNIFNVDKQTIKDLLIRNNIKLRTTRTYKLSQECRKSIIDDFNLGISRKDIIPKWGISKSYLSQLINGYRRI